MIAVNVGGSGFNLDNLGVLNLDDLKLPIELEESIEAYKVKSQETIQELGDEEICDMENHSIFHVLDILGGNLFFIEELVSKKNELYLNYVEDIKENIFSYRDSVGNINDLVKKIENIGLAISKLEKCVFLKNDNNFLTLKKAYNFILRKVDIFKKGYEQKYLFRDINIDFIIESLSEPNQFFFDSDLQVVFDKNKKNEYNYFVKFDYESIYGNKFNIPFSLVEVIINLVFNSRKNSEKGSNIYLYLNQTENNIHLKVIDEGKGIPENMLDEVFKFGVTTSKKGTGMGLVKTNYSISKLGGEILIKTKTGVGTMFDINIPYKKEEA